MARYASLLGMFLLFGKTDDHTPWERKASHPLPNYRRQHMCRTHCGFMQEIPLKRQPLRRKILSPTVKEKGGQGVGRGAYTSDNVTRETDSPLWGALQEAPVLDKQGNKQSLQCFSLLVQHRWTEEKVRALSRKAWPCFLNPAKGAFEIPVLSLEVAREVWLHT